MANNNPDRFWAALALTLSVLALGFFISGLDDGIHLFEDQNGTEQTVLTTAFENNLLPSLILAALIVGCIWLAASSAAARLCRISFAQAAMVDALTYFPLAILLIVPIRYFPAVAQTSSFLFLISSTLGTALLFTAVVLTVILKLTLWPFPKRIREESKRRALSNSDVGWIIFGVMMAVLVVSIPIFNDNWSFGGDEPHYLIIAHSIAEDGDIYIEDDHEAGVWRDFTAHEIIPQYFRRDRNGEIIPFHKIGLPLLAAVPYSFAGKLGAVMLIGFFAALAAANVYWLIIKIIPDRAVAILAAAWTALTIPNLPLSFLFFSEMPTALFTLFSLNLTIRKNDSLPRFPWLVPFVIWTLPWFHARGLVTSAVLSVMLVVRLRSVPLKAAAIAALCLFMAFTLPLWNWWIYDDFSPVAEMGPDQGAAFDLDNVIRGVGGMLFDQEFGMLLYNPVIILALLGCYYFWRRDRWAFIWILLVIGSSVGPSVLYRMWWGGGSSPGRYYVAIMHLAALPLAALLAGQRGRRWHKVFAIGAILSVAISIALMIHSNLLVNIREEPAAALMLTSVSAGQFDAVEWWPSWFGDGIRAWPLTGLLLIAGAVAVAVILLLVRIANKFGDGIALPKALAVTGSFAVFLIVAGGYCWIAEQITPGEPNGFEPRSKESVLSYQERYRHESHRAVDLAGTLSPDSLPYRGFSAEFLYSTAGLSADDKAPRRRSLRIAPGETDIPLQPQTPFWAGEYELALGLRSESGNATAEVSIFDASESGSKEWQPAAQAGISLTSEFNISSILLSLPRNSQSIIIKIKNPKTLRFTHVLVTPRSLKRISSWELPPELFDRETWRFDDYLLFTSPDSIFRPEGDSFWTVGDSTGLLTVVSKEPFSQITMELRARPWIDLELQTGRETERIGFEQKRNVSITKPVRAEQVGGYWLAGIRATTRGRFVPSEHIEDSLDHRALGAFVNVELK